MDDDMSLAEEYMDMIVAHAKRCDGTLQIVRYHEDSLHAKCHKCQWWDDWLGALDE